MSGDFFVMNHKDIMEIVLDLAERGKQSVSPNPMVGAVLVKNVRGI